jgi:transcriptional regulator with XRE-family HTH domain
MQELFSRAFYGWVMSDKTNASRLRTLREAAGISQRELARIIEVDSSNVSFWERSGCLPRSELLLPIAKALGVSVEELLGEAKAQLTPVLGGKARQMFEAVSKLPRRQQQKILDLLEPFIKQHSRGREKTS